MIDFGINTDRITHTGVLQADYSVDEPFPEWFLVEEGMVASALNRPGDLEGVAIEQSQKAIIDEAKQVAVPLPAAAWLFGSALLGFIMMSNRRSL